MVLRRMLRDEQGQSTLEYMLILAMIMAALIFGATRLRRAVDENLLGAMEDQTKNVGDRIRAIDAPIGGGAGDDGGDVGGGG